MKKRITAMALAFVMVLGTVAVAAGTEKTISVTPMTLTINGQAVTPTKSNGDAAEVFAYDGATYVPLRYLSELLGIKVEWDKNDPNTAKLTGNVTLPSGGDGTYTGSSQGFGGTITATITVVNGKVTACTLEGASETPAIGGAALSTLEEQIVAAGDPDIDGVSGATYTSKGAREAVQAALKAAKGVVSNGTLSFTPGTYSGEAYGNTSTIRVDVTVSDSAITDIALIEQEESAILFDAAWENVTGDILEYQSLDVDMVSGASVSSHAILAAVENALSLSGADLSVLKVARQRESVKATQIEKTADVVIVGGGGAGLAAAVTAIEEGASVIIVEASAFVGGNTLVCGGIYNTPDAEMQSKVEMGETVKTTVEAAFNAKPVNEEHKAAMADVKADYETWKAAGSEGLFDSPAWFSLQTWNSGDKVANKTLVDILANNSYDGYQWLKSLGVDFSDKIQQGAGSLYQRTHTAILPKGEGYIKAYLTALEKTPDAYELLLNTRAQEFIMDGKAVVGVTAVDTNGNTYTIKANNGVVLTTGGFAGNIELRQKYCEGEKWTDLGKGVKTTNLKTVTGDGILMAQEIGAAFVDMDQIQLLHLGSYLTGATVGAISYKTSKVDEVIFVNTEGNRFVAEDARRDVICNAVAAQPDAYYWIIHDSSNIDPYSNVVEGYIKGGYMYRADTLEELAALIGAPAENLIAAVDEYNEAFDKGVDVNFGRTLFVSKLEGEGPWFATQKVASAHHTMGGVKIDGESHMYYEDGTVIPGLFAAGEVAGGIHGGNRVGGNAVVDTVVFGRIAGANAANNK